MNYLSAENISKNFNERWLFKGINFGILKGDKVALVGQNGSGKTTLMNVLAGVIPADEGTISIRKGITVGYLSQNPVFNESLSVMDSLFDGDSPTVQAIKAYENAMLHHNDDELTRALELMEKYQAWDYESRVEQVLGKLGIHDLDKPITSLSGGQRKRVAMAKILIEEPDLIIMDEPTNHLDLETIEWLEQTLSSQNVTLLLVTHDRYFLDRVCNNIVELDNGKTYPYKGNYGYFLEKKAEREAMEAASIDKAKNLLRTELEWMRRQPKARGTKAQYRVDAFYDLKDKASQTKDDSKVQLNVKMARQGSKILEIDDLSKSFGEQKIVANFSYVFKKKDRIGIIGKNGAGKSTFLNMITQNLKPDSGNITTGETVVYGYYQQGDLEYRDGQRVIDIVTEIAEYVTLGNGQSITASQFLTHFKFEPKVQYTLVEKLSGGEKRRLALMRVLIKNPNFLILDEPTNDLDIQTLNILEDFLMEFGGCLLLVSHDRYFMDKLVEHLFVFEGEGQIRDFPGNYTDYREWKDELDKQEAQTKSSPKKAEEPIAPVAQEASVATSAKKKLSYKEQKEYDSLEEEMTKLGKRKTELTEKLNAGGSYEELAAWANEIEQITDQLDEKELRWLELSEMM
ncbi:ABC-F family ATP-binding cassette domain-containing protein [Flectobacillus longus]|uniref:ABC-F family ATP-binding cassette domain-containing protein n=1 Tax=Flectobacillus longus TaxID=2984207 RepID=UPI0024B82615|nr:ABC-F family ATP-binding cassette domain-containing protein [Flectobacillus longus]MDI9880497.1 ABC-F family ATP-binding cassette domain-containing protein [Flectobacillus longus]